MAKKKLQINEDGTLKVYSYLPGTGVYIGEDSAHPDPLEKGEYLIPAFATTIEPPKPKEGFVTVFDGDKWTQSEVKQEPKPEPSNEEKAAQARNKRNGLLFESDWRILSDVPAKHSKDWAEYRHALRDVPQQPGFPVSINWPKPPNE
jgi:hypothetical protein